MPGYFAPGEGGGPFDDFLARFSGAQQPGGRGIDITRLMSEHGRALLGAAAAQATEWGGGVLDAVHLLWAATQAPGSRELLQRAGADPDELAAQVEQAAPRGGSAEEELTLTPGAKRVLLDAYRISRGMRSSYLGPEHVVLAMAVNPEAPSGALLRSAGVSPETLQRGSMGPQQGGSGNTGDSGRSADSMLEQFGRDLTELARDGGIDPVVGREEEIEQAIEVLSRRTKNNPVLVGEAGVGKTAIVEGLAQRIVDGEVPDTVAGRRVVQLDMTAMVGGTRYRGDFEERITVLLKEIREQRDSLIVFIDELHTVVGAGSSEGSAGAGNMLKPALARGELHVIGATTLEEYRTDIEADAALERRFQPIQVPEPTAEQALSILRGLRDRYEAHHQVRFSDEALGAAVTMAQRYINDRFLPDKAIDLIDQAGARVRVRSGRHPERTQELRDRVEQLRRDRDQAVSVEDYEGASALRDEIRELEGRLAGTGGAGADCPEVTVDDVATVVARLTGVPVSQLTQQERERLLNLEDYLHERVVGQDDAVHAVAEAVRRSRAGLAEPGRPSGSFLFLGPTGVGKTELARALAEALFGAAEKMIRLDMSEYGEAHTVSRLIGSPPGYVGYDDAGQLTEAVRRSPYSVVLLDEVEKAHPDVFNVLLQVLDDGRLTDGRGRTVNFGNTVLIMTSNLGSELITGSMHGALGFSSNVDAGEAALQERLTRRLKESFRPEFLNRIDETIVFRQLQDDELHRITALLLEHTRERARAQDVEVDLDTAAIDWLSRTGYQPEFGARPLRRTIQRQVDNELSRMLLDGQLAAGRTVRVGADDDGLTFTVEDTVDGDPALV